MLPTLIRTAILLTPLHVLAQNCYYPNGDLADGMAACSSNGGLCCPLNWACLSNGLCQLDQSGTDTMTGRYTCTDNTWQSDSCPQICTHNLTANGNEAVLQCDNGQYCCDGDRSFDCCTTENEDFFSLASGSSYAFISSTQAPTSVSSAESSTTSSSDATTASQASSSDDSSTTTAPSTAQSTPSSLPASASSTTASTASSSSAASSRHTSTITSQALTTNTNGAVSTVILIQTVSAADDPSSTSNHGSSSHLGLIVGIAVGVPVFLLACALLALLLWKRRKAKRDSYVSPLSEDHTIYSDKYGHQVGHVAPDGRAPELDSYPVADVYRSKSGRKSELEGSMHSPAISRVSGGSFAPPGYSPTTPNLHVVNEEPQELWGGYVPYRPPQSQDNGNAQG